MKQPPSNNQQPLYDHTGYYPNPGQFYASPVSPLSLPSRYSNGLLLLLCGAYGLGWLLSFIGQAAFQENSNFLTNCGISLFFGIYSCLFIIDRRGVISLQGLINWQRRTAGKRLLLGLLCFFTFPFLLAIYFVRTYQLFRRMTRGTIQTGAPMGRRRSTIGVVIGSVVTLFVLMFANAEAMANVQPTAGISAIGVSPTAAATTIVHTAHARATTTTTKGTPTRVPTKVPVVLPTHTPTSTPTAVIQSTPTPAQLTPTPAPSLFLVFTGASALDYSQGSVSVHTLPGAALTITVRYCSGYPATSDSLQGTFYADGAGNYTWTWKPETKCRGTATALVVASENGQSLTQTYSFTVQ